MLDPGELPMHSAVKIVVVNTLVIGFQTFGHDKSILECADHIVKGQLLAVGLERISALRAAPDLQDISCFKLLEYPVDKRGWYVSPSRKRSSRQRALVIEFVKYHDRIFDFLDDQHKIAPFFVVMQT